VKDNTPVISLANGIETFDLYTLFMFSWNRLRSAAIKNRLKHYLWSEFEYIYKQDDVICFELGPLIIKDETIFMRQYSIPKPAMHLRIKTRQPEKQIIQYIREHPEQQVELMKKFDLSIESMEAPT